MKVMRHRVGDELMVTDGKGKLFSSRIISEGKKEVTFEIIQLKKEEPAPTPQIHIAIAPTKNIDRFEFFLEKATEIGIAQITPIITQRSERDKIKQERLQKIILAAMKQSLRLWLPKLNELISLKDFFTHDSRLTTHDFICHCQSQNLPSLASLYKRGENVLIMIGPEGDFTSEEITLAEQNGFASVSLSESRLRTETAGIIALNTIQILNG